jgi:hypothetical protein
VKAKIFQKLDNIYFFLSPSRWACSRSRALFREITESLILANGMLLASTILVYPSYIYLDILDPRTSSDYLRLILSNLVYHPSNSVSVLHGLAQSAAQPPITHSSHCHPGPMRHLHLLKPSPVSRVRVWLGCHHNYVAPVLESPRPYSPANHFACARLA